MTIKYLYDVGKLIAQIFVTNQARTHPPNLPIQRSIDIEFLPNKVCPRLPVLDLGKKKGFKAYGSIEMTRKDKVWLVIDTLKWDTLFNNKGMVT